MGNDPQGNASPPSCIIYFHEGFSPYLPFALRQARISNPDARIILLGDYQNRIQGIQYEHYLLSDYDGRHQEFLECYRHFHPGHLGDERRCIERWVYLSEFLKKKKIEEFLFLDSDMLLFCDVGEILSKSRGYDAAGAPMFWAFCYFLKKNLVAEFTDWIIQQYRNPAMIRKWDAAFRRHLSGEKEQGAIIQDMALAKMFIEERGIRVLDLTHSTNGKIVDSGRFGGAFQHKKKDVDILFQHEAGGPVETVVAGRTVLLAAVHVAGFYKSHMPGLTGWSWSIFFSFFRPNYRKNIKQLFWYGLNGFRFRRYLRRRRTS
jgi:hypothetical protein